jgi:hypothetical protein
MHPLHSRVTAGSVGKPLDIKRSRRDVEPRVGGRSIGVLEAMVAQVRSRSASARGYTTRQGSRSSSICEKCFRRTANRARGISPSKIASMFAPRISGARESRSARQHKITPVRPLTWLPSRACRTTRDGSTLPFSL